MLCHLLHRLHGVTHIRQTQLPAAPLNLNAGQHLIPLYVTLLGGCTGAAGDGAPKPLVFVRPSDPLQLLVQRLFSERCHMAPVIDGDPLGDSLLINSIDMATSLRPSPEEKEP